MLVGLKISICLIIEFEVSYLQFTESCKEIDPTCEHASFASCICSLSYALFPSPLIVTEANSRSSSRGRQGATNNESSLRSETKRSGGDSIRGMI
jgi:hypothetical protein